MSVIALGDYKFEPLDIAANFHGARVIYAGWERHLMFSSPYAWPLPPDLPFGHFVAGPLAQAFGQHPDWEKIDWRQATWTRNGEPFSPVFEKSVDENGLGHKDSLTFQTPNVSGLGGRGI
jgi:phenol/toluene 2-monooxygenase (NADH) P4/A4